MVYTVLVAVLAFAPRAAEACSVCSAGREDEQRSAFLLTTIFLSVLPLLFVGAVIGVVWWLHRRARAQEQQSVGDGVAPARAET